MATIGQRIRKALAYNNMKQAELVEKTGISKGALSSYLSEKYKPKQNNIYLMASVLNVSEAWLMGLDVPMERKTSSNVSPDSLQPVPREDEKELLEHYNKLNAAGKEKLQDYAEDLSYNPKYTEDTVLKNA